MSLDLLWIGFPFVQWFSLWHWMRNISIDDYWRIIEQNFAKFRIQWNKILLVCNNGCHILYVLQDKYMVG